MRVAAVREGRSLQLLQRLLHGVLRYVDRVSLPICRAIRVRVRILVTRGVPLQHQQRGLRDRLGFGSSTETYHQIYCGVYYTEYRVTSTA